VTGPPLTAAPRDPAVGALEVRLGFSFPDPGLALAALTHKSFVNEHRGEGLSDNERLEFLGDAVIDLAVSHRLMDRFPEAREGELSKIRAALVDEAALARMARALGLGPLLRLGRGEELTSGREKASILADALEAVVAVLYLAGGLPRVLAVVEPFLAEAFARAAAGTLDRDYKTQLQELAQSRVRATPRYRVVSESGPDHEKVFEVELEVRGEALGRGTGRSKKDAEQAAARAGLVALASQPSEHWGEVRPLLTPEPGSLPTVQQLEAELARLAAAAPAPAETATAPVVAAGPRPRKAPAKRAPRGAARPAARGKKRPKRKTS